MAYDEELAERIRGLLPEVPVDEKKMFGGLAFLVGGHMSVVASGKGGLMVRCDPGDSERLLTEPGASRMEMRGSEMSGWLRVTGDAVARDETGDDALARWVEVGTTYAASLPPKEGPA
jgi:hypothetical protein